MEEIFIERYNLTIERLKEIKKSPNLNKDLDDFFVCAAKRALLVDEIIQKLESDFFETATLDQLKTLNSAMYDEVLEENYDSSYANPTYACNKLGKDLGQILCYVYEGLRKAAMDCFGGNLENALVRIELLIEVYSCFELEHEDVTQYVKDVIYSFERDYSEIFQDALAEARLNPEYDVFTSIVKESNLTTPNYLYRYGKYVGRNELIMSEYLNTLSDKEIKDIASTYVEGYKRGFVATGKDLSIKSVTEFMFNIGFERIVREAMRQLQAEGLRPVVGAFDIGTIFPNEQYAFDHKMDEALYLDKAYVKRKLESVKNAYDKRKELAAQMAGPAVLEVFGSKPFEPKNKEEALKLSEAQQKISSQFRTDYIRTVYEYIIGDERSFTIMALPVPDFGDDFEEFFKETVRINTLDTEVYGKIQQKIIDALDQAEYVHVTGRGKNKTDIKVSMHKLDDPAKETNFENCLADVNIPLGEVFTSPMLKKTNGVLNVSSVFLRDINFKDLTIVFEDGCVKEYSCSNFDDEEECKRLIKENILNNHETLPIGEFAIGTNTTAYSVSRKYNCIYKLPILIVEKMGPHFAVGDTCYSREEDLDTYNPDGKKIVARENEISALRKTEPQKAYFGCHTDITIPYEELGDIVAVTSEGNEIPIIEQGRFVLEGTEMLNEALDE